MDLSIHLSNNLINGIIAGVFATLVPAFIYSMIAFVAESMIGLGASRSFGFFYLRIAAAIGIFMIPLLGLIGWLGMPWWGCLIVALGIYLAMISANKLFSSK